jgi:hypothetical protein
MCTVILSVETNGQQPSEEEWLEYYELFKQVCVFGMTGGESQDEDDAGFEVSEDMASILAKDGITPDCACAVYAKYTIAEARKELRGTITEEDILKFFISYIEKITDRNSELYTKMLADIYKLCQDKPVDIEVQVAGPSSEQIKVIQLLEKCKVKLTIGKSVKYYLLDSGADDCVISADYALELLNDGLFTEDDIIDPQYYSLGDGSVILCERIVLNGVKIGNYVLNNVVFCVIDDDVDFICGKNVLDAFNSWKIYNDRSILELTKK